MLIWELSKYSEIKLQTTCLLVYKAFLKDRKRYGTSFPHFLHDFWRKIFILLYSIIWPNFIFWLSLIRETLSDVYCNSLLTRLWRHKSQNWPYLPNQAAQKPSQDKSLNILRTKRTFKMKQKAFFITFEVLLLKPIIIKKIRRWESDFKDAVNDYC